MSAVQKAAKNPKRPTDSDDEESDTETPQEDTEYDDEVVDDEEEDEASGEIKEDTDLEEEYDEYDYEVAAKVGAEPVETEPMDIALLSEMENQEDETLLVSKDSLHIHTTPYLTKYEFTKVMALRAQQILTGAPSTVPPSAFPGDKYPIDPYSVALMELKMSRMPIIIGRRLPNNTIIRIPVHALLIPE
jgi:DNA-directed RNA polymerase subunit K/omega